MTKSMVIIVHINGLIVFLRGTKFDYGKRFTISIAYNIIIIALNINGFSLAKI
jgi:hypothetical protein